MLPQYSVLAADLDRIRRFLSATPEEQQTVDQRRFAYIACISALYSSFERFAERTAFEFGKLILANPSNISNEQFLTLRKRYVRNASVLLGQALGTGRYQEVTELDVAKSLTSFLNNSSQSLDLRLELIALHNSNLRWDAFLELFRWAAADLPSNIINSDAVKKWMSLNSDATDDTLTEVLKSELSDLVERRNEVAHRGIPGEIISYDRLRDKVNYVEAISLGLVASLARPLLATAIENGKSSLLGTPREYFKKKRVVIIPSLESAVAEGDSILLPGVHATRWGRVLTVKVDDQRVPRAEKGTEVGLLLDFAAWNGTPLHVWNTPDPSLSDPPAELFGKWGPLQPGS
ncbi:HEPN domain-containing protein [Actinophytocola algeriensis]|uniref:RiboL-PSP-HEPN domain-containing protein n=1 Tax=Actinophytocola algeriensis TaxID=1768010 RepID=A0A7W7PZ48_9PSEU|nr:HEPN domain-containing protein [Actinophytocola algeriensis]MBB4903999.1 hypothetical protein [Actinophytocola algeriensis]MBE1477144.1 hypothetical protein [Actinophytocola algeriensis]